MLGYCFRGGQGVDYSENGCCYTDMNGCGG